ELLALLPALLENLLGQDPVLFYHRTQYQSFVLPFLMNGAIAGYARLARARPGPWPPRAPTAAMISSLAFAPPTGHDPAVPRLRLRLLLPRLSYGSASSTGRVPISSWRGNRGPPVST